MNKRIKELAEQASVLSRQEHPEIATAVTLNDILGNTERKVYVIDDATTQKFAELIIQECADIVHDRILEIDIEFPGKGVSNYLKEQFGIEE